MGVHRKSGKVPKYPLDDMVKGGNRFGWTHVATAAIGFDPAIYTVATGTVSVDVTVIHEVGAPKPVQVQWTTDIGTTGVLTWDRGDLTPRTITLDVWDETEFSRTFEITLHDPVDAVITVPVATISTIPIYLTSRPYPVEVIEGLDAEPAVIAYGRIDGLILDELAAGNAVISGGELRQPLHSYTNWPAEALDAGNAVISGGELRQPLHSYTNWPAEALDAGNAVISGGELLQILISYTDWPAEALDAGNAVITGGSLT